MNIKPKKIKYNINRKEPCCLLVFNHSSDKGTRFIEVALVDGNDSPIDISGATAFASIVTKDNILLADNVPCTISDSSVIVPIDNAVIRGRKCDFYVEISIIQGEKALTLPFPLWVRMRGSILDDAETTDKSIGIVPELLRDAKKELERVQELIDVKNGKSAYEIACDNGFFGTEAEWLLSLRGQNYVLTDNDKQEIAQMVFELIPEAEEGVY